MNVIVIDGHGGGLGGALVKAVRSRRGDAHIIAVGTNSTAAAAMKKAGADEAASGENAIVICCRKADVIVGPVACVIADSMLGEITPAMAAAVGSAAARRVLVPVNRCGTTIVGAGDKTVSELVSLAAAEV